MTIKTSFNPMIKYSYRFHSKKGLEDVVEVKGSLTLDKDIPLSIRMKSNMTLAKSK